MAKSRPLLGLLAAALMLCTSPVQAQPLSFVPALSLGELVGELAPPAIGEVRARRRATRSSAAREAASVRSSSRTSPEGYYGLEMFLVRDKIMPGLTLDLQLSTFGFGFEFGLIFLAESDPSDTVDGSFLGGMLGFHGYARLLKQRSWDLRIGTGFDAFGMWAIHGDEWKLGMPLIVEARIFPSNRLTAFLQARMFLLHSDGLETGVDRDGHESVPLLLVAGLGGWS